MVVSFAVIALGCVAVAVLELRRRKRARAITARFAALTTTDRPPIRELATLARLAPLHRPHQSARTEPEGRDQEQVLEQTARTLAAAERAGERGPIEGQPQSDCEDRDSKRQVAFILRELRAEAEGSRDRRSGAVDVVIQWSPTEAYSILLPADIWTARRYAWAAAMLVLGTTFGCSDGLGPHQNGGSGQLGGGASDAGTGNTAGQTETGGTSGTAGAGGGPAGSGSSGDAGGAGGSAAGTGGSAAGAGGSAAGSTAGAGGGLAGQGGAVVLQPWPTDDAVVTVDGMNQFGTNLSGLVDEPPTDGVTDILWGVQNKPSTLYCLQWNGTTWAGMTSNNWMNGKTLHYPNGAGSPDAEGLSRVEWSSHCDLRGQ